MANNFQISTAAQNAACNALCALLNSGSIKIYTGSQPANANTAVTSQTLLCTFTLNSTAFGSASSGVATLQGTTLLATSGATGTAAWFRACDSSGNAVADGSCGTSSADMILNTTSIVNGSQVQLINGTITMPAH